LNRLLRSGLVPLSICSLLALSRVQAAPTGDQTLASVARPAWLWPLGLSASDEELLRSLSAKAAAEEKLRARQLLLTLVRNAPWKAEVVVDHVRAALALLAADETFDRAQKPLQDLTTRMKGARGCPKLLGKVEYFLSGLESGGWPLPPLQSEDVAGACGKRAKAHTPKLDPTTEPVNESETAVVRI
jgi:hypothetical protein